MSEFVSWIPIIALVISSISAAIGFLTYRRVSRKYYSRTVSFNGEIKPKENVIMFDIRGSGLLQKIGIKSLGSPYVLISIDIDGLSVFRKTIMELYQESSTYLRQFSFGNIQDGSCSLEMALNKNFYKNIKVSTENQHTQVIQKISGNIELNIHNFFVLER
jgi:hypothetical protein